MWGGEGSRGNQSGGGGKREGEEMNRRGGEGEEDVMRGDREREREREYSEEEEKRGEEPRVEGVEEVIEDQSS